jgi:hypothetical protein
VFFWLVECVMMLLSWYFWVCLFIVILRYVIVVKILKFNKKLIWVVLQGWKEYCNIAIWD